MQPLAERLRPQSIQQLIGQDHLSGSNSILYNAIESQQLHSMILWGPPGTGKTTIANIIAHTLQIPYFSLSAISAGVKEVREIIAKAAEMQNCILFIDEIHRLARPAEEMLYLAMEDYRVDVVVGKGVGANAIGLDLPSFTLIGATTRAGLLPSPLRDRFGFTAHLDFYEADELEQIVHRSADLLKVEITQDAAVEISKRSRGTPRIANRLLRRVRDYAQVHTSGKVDIDVAKKALALFEIDDRGLDRIDRAILDALINKFGGGPVGLSTLAVAVGEEPETVEDMCEPFLVRIGYLARSARGRIATPSAYQLLGKSVPAQQVLDITE
jgi:Holliday junction DNA helicase RuvB